MSMENKFGERIAKLEQKTEGHENRINKYEEDQSLLYRLTIVSEQQQKFNEEQQRQLNNMDETFKTINENLTTLNHTSNELKEDIQRIGKRQDDFEDVFNTENDKGKISIYDIFSEWINWWIVLIPTGIIGALLYRALGL